MADNGPASGTPEINVGSGSTQIFLETHTANNVSTPTGSGIPGGLALGASGLNNLGPGVFAGSTSATATSPTLNAGATSTTGIYVNVQGTLPAPTSIIKNPA